MNFYCRPFEQLTNEELLEILRLRSAVFVVEQACIYQDIDGYDRDALHLWIEDSGEIIAYLRLLPPDSLRTSAVIGRVLATRRRIGLGTKIVSFAIEKAIEHYHTDTIELHAQTYAQGLYEKLGFSPVSEVFPEDGIPHIQMRLMLTPDRLISSDTSAEGIIV